MKDITGRCTIQARALDLSAVKAAPFPTLTKCDFLTYLGLPCGNDTVSASALSVDKAAETKFSPYFMSPLP